MCRVLFGVTSSTFHLSATLIHHSNKYSDTDPEFVEQVLNSLQVDDLNTGAENDLQAFGFYCKCKERLNGETPPKFYFH